MSLPVFRGCFHVTVAEWVIATDSTWPAKPKILAVWPFAAKTCQPLSQPNQEHCAVTVVIFNGFRDLAEIYWSL